MKKGIDREGVCSGQRTGGIAVHILEIGLVLGGELSNFFLVLVVEYLKLICKLALAGGLVVEAVLHSSGFIGVPTTSGLSLKPAAPAIALRSAGAAAASAGFAGAFRGGGGRCLFIKIAHCAI